MPETVVIVGAGVPDGVGGALAHRFAKEGYAIIASGRTLAKVEATAASVRDAGGSAEAIRTDVASEDDMAALFARVKEIGQPIAAIIYNAGNNRPIPFEDLTPEQFTDFWRSGCFGGFLTAHHAMPILRAQGRGSMFFTGASGSLRGKPNFGHFASAKAGLRNLVQSLAREYGPHGVHVAHVIVDGVINGNRLKESRLADYLEQLGEDGSLDPAAIAETFWSLHVQPKSAWTHEIDLRPFKERW
ncbi:MAG: SDR family NAD(P)-dependent oxidoreductase [Pseudomonadota bacterium]